MARTRFSIFGDSLSTYEGMNPERYLVFYDACQARINGLRSARDTWWYRVIDAFDGMLCANDSFSGSLVSGLLFPSANTAERIDRLKADERPDLLLCYIGFNDFGYSIPTRRKRKWFSRRNVFNFEDSFGIMLDRMKASLPGTKIVCGTLTETCVVNHPEQVFPYDFDPAEPLSAYNDVILCVCRRKQAYVADLNGLGIVYPTLDGGHATAEGHRMLAEGWIKEIKRLQLC